MPSSFNFADPRLSKLDGFQVEIDETHERADIILNRPPYNIVSMPQRDQLRRWSKPWMRSARQNRIVRSISEHSSSGSIGGFIRAHAEHVPKLAGTSLRLRCAKPVIVANRGYCFGVRFRHLLPATSGSRRRPHSMRCRSRNSDGFLVRRIRPSAEDDGIARTS